MIGCGTGNDAAARTVATKVINPDYIQVYTNGEFKVCGWECLWSHFKSKLSGVRQVIAVTLNTFSKPIPTPVENLRPARETCEQCHWPAKFYASQLRSRVHYASDEKNTRSEIRVLLNTGGGDSSMGPPSGIHWHMALSRKIEYVASDRARQVIPWVRATEPSGTQNVYRSDGIAGAEPIDDD